jgi:hypothetical protein
MLARKKPVVVEAFHYQGQARSKWPKWMRDYKSESGVGIMQPEDGSLFVPTLEGTMVGEKGDWIIQGVASEVYACKPDIFDLTYESVPETAETNASAVFTWDAIFPSDFELMTPSAIERVLQDNLLEIRAKILSARERRLGGRRDKVLA